MRAKPPEHAYYQQILGATITYDRPEDCVIFDTRELELPLPAYDQDQFELAIRKCKLLLVDRVKLDSTREAIELVFEKSPGMLWTLNQVAASLYISARTLQRRLGCEGSNYQQVLDDWLKQLAAQYLEAEKLSVEASAMLLGYNDEANCRPSTYRQAIHNSAHRLVFPGMPWSMGLSLLTPVSPRNCPVFAV
jgi:AraC-like DNA-binding protein